MRKFLFPDAAGITGAASTTAPADSPVRHLNSIPAKDAALLEVSKFTADKWAASSFVTLAWKTQADFAAEVAAFSQNLSARNSTGGKRSGQAQDVDLLDMQAEDAVSFVKTYINEKFGPANARAHYSEFGLEHRKDHYELPRNRQQRKDALRMMVAAIADNGFADKTYGTAFWADIETRYHAAASAASTGASDVSASVSSLVTLRTTLRRVLHSILLLLEANYPDTFEQTKREWGFLKETY